MSQVDLQYSKKIQLKGNSVFFYKRIDIDALTGTDTWHVGVARLKSDLNHDEPFKEIELEDGSFVYAPDNVKSELKITTSQTDYNTRKFFKSEVKNTGFQFWFPLNPAGDTKMDLLIPLGQINAGNKISSPGGQTEFTIKILPASQAITFNSASLSAVGSLSALAVSGTASVAAFDYYDYNLQS